VSTRYLNQVELAERWRFSPRTLENWRCRGEGPSFHKIGGKVFYSLEDVEAYEQEQRRKKTAPGGGRKRQTTATEQSAG
jgi:Helix-turn-helix domain